MRGIPSKCARLSNTSVFTSLSTKWGASSNSLAYLWDRQEEAILAGIKLPKLHSTSDLKSNGAAIQATTKEEQQKRENIE